MHFLSPHISLLGDVREPFFRMSVHLSSWNCWIHATATCLLASQPESMSGSHQGEQGRGSSQSVCNHNQVTITRNTTALYSLQLLQTDLCLPSVSFPEEVRMSVGPAAECWREDRKPHYPHTPGLLLSLGLQNHRIRLYPATQDMPFGRTLVLAYGPRQVDISNSCRHFQLLSVWALEVGLDFVVTDDNIVSLVSPCSEMQVTVGFCLMVLSLSRC